TRRWSAVSRDGLAAWTASTFAAPSLHGHGWSRLSGSCLIGAGFGSEPVGSADRGGCWWAQQERMEVAVGTRGVARLAGAGGATSRSTAQQQSIGPTATARING